MPEQPQRPDMPGDSASTPDAVPEWLVPSTVSERALLAYPPVEDEHGDLPTGAASVQASSAAEPSIWVTAVAYGGDIQSRLERRDCDSVALHLRTWQARRLAYQLLDLAERVDPDGGTDGGDGDA